MNTRLPTCLAFLLAAALLGCSAPAPDTDASSADVPPGDPPFTPLTTTWVIDNVGVLSTPTVQESSALCQRLQDDGIAELVVLVQNGVRHPVDYATHYGRWLKLGRKGLSTEGGNNGIVWLIRPDAPDKMTYSIGRGLPRLTSGHMVDIINQAKDYFNFNNYDEGVRALVRLTDASLRKLQTEKGESP